MQLEAASRPAGLAPSKAATGATSPPSNMKNLQRHQQQQQRQLRVASGVPAESSGTAVQEQQQQQEDSEGEEEDNYEEEEEDEDEEEYEEGFFMTFYTEKRHLEPVRLFHQGPPLLLLLPASFKGQQPPASSASSSIPLSAFSNLQQMAPIQWRMREKLKTVSVALVLCLNIGIDPPDVMKPNPCAKLECWQDPFSQPPQKALENIGRALQLQYEVGCVWYG